MASGFFLGGLGEGLSDSFDRTMSTVGNAKYQQGILQLAQQRQQQDQMRQAQTDYQNLAKQYIDNLSQHVDADKIEEARAHPQMPADIQQSRIIKRWSQQAEDAKKMFSVGFQHLGMKDYATVFDSQVTNILASPPSTALEAASARAKEGPIGEQLKLSEVNKNRSIAGQPPIDVSGRAANPANPDLDTATQLGGKQFKSTGNPQSDSILKGIDNGDTPPDLKGLYGKTRTAILAGAEDNGINLAQKQLQWDRAKKITQSLNGPQMVRYAGLNESVINTIDEVNGLAVQMNQSGIPLLNKANLTKLIQTEGNSPRGQLAARYISAVNTLKEEFANLAQGGYAPTEPAWKLANEQINGDYGVRELGASLGEVQKLVKIRYNAIPGIGDLGPTAPNQYTGKSGTQDFQATGIPGVSIREKQ